MLLTMCRIPFIYKDDEQVDEIIDFVQSKSSTSKMIIMDLAEARPLVTGLTRGTKWIDNSTCSRTSGRVRIAAKHGNTRTKLGTSKRNHVLSDMDGNLLALVMMSVHQDPLNEIIAVLITSNIDEGNAWAVWMSSCDNSKVSIQKLWSTNLETLLNHFGSELIHTVVV
jgi:hypothetical protein